MKNFKFNTKIEEEPGNESQNISMFNHNHYISMDTEGRNTGSPDNAYENVDNIQSEISDDVILPDIKMKSNKHVEFENEHEDNEYQDDQ